MERGIARRFGRAGQRNGTGISKAVKRFVEAGSGNVKKLQGIDPPEFRLRVGDFRARFLLDGDIMRILRIRNRKDAYR